MPRTARKPRMAAHHDTTFRPVLAGVGNDDWQRQADAAAWAAISGLPAGLYLGAIEPIPVPPELRAKLREAGKALAAASSPERADALLRLAHEAVYGVPDTTPPLESPQKPAGGVSAAEWWDTPAGAPNAMADALARFAEEARAALHNVTDDPANEGEAGFAAREWWQ